MGRFVRGGSNIRTEKKMRPKQKVIGAFEKNVYICRMAPIAYIACNGLADKVI